MMTNSGMTVYNKYISGGLEKYQRVTLIAVAWENRKAANVLQSGLISADSVTVYIPFALGTNYVAPKAWQALVTKTGKWTLQEGDYIVKGLVSDEITEFVPAVISPPTPAVPAFTITSLKEKYDSVMQIKSVDTYDMGSTSMRHWQVGAG